MLATPQFFLRFSLEEVTMGQQGFAPKSNSSPAKKSLGFPWYFAIDDRLAQIIGTPDGSMDIQLFNPETGEMESDLTYLPYCFEPGRNVQRLSAVEFQQRIDALKA
jgi:hypothetical protein